MGDLSITTESAQDVSSNNRIGRDRQADAEALDVMRGLVSGRTVSEVETLMLSHEQVQAPVIHRFGPGIYIRELFLGAGTIAIGHSQKREHMNVMLKGRVTIVNEDGTMQQLVAPAVFVGKPGRKIGYIHEDMVWQNIYATDETDVEKLEEMLLDKSDAWKSDAALRCAEVLQIELDRKDYYDVLEEFGIPHEVAVQQSINSDDQVGFPFGGYKVSVGRSMIDGVGLFATADIDAGELIAPARINGMRTPAGSKTNHAAIPNAEFVMRSNGDIDLVATRRIDGCKGGQQGQEITVDYRQALSLSGLRRIK